MKVKKLLLVGIPLCALICAGAGLVLTGIVKLPFLKKAPPKGAAAVKPKPKPKKPPAKKAAIPPPRKVTVKQKPAPTSDPTKGARKVAKLWNEMETKKLQELTTDWREPELARVLALMDTGKVAELLAEMPPKRASALTRAIQREASRLPVVPTGS